MLTKIRKAGDNYQHFHRTLKVNIYRIPATKGFEIGSGFAGTRLCGSEHNDAFEMRDGKIRTATNRSGGVQGGISNGEEINFRVAFKPTPTIAKKQASVDASGTPCEVVGHGRHDPCVLPRAVPVVEAMAALVLADHLLRQRAQRVFNFYSNAKNAKIFALLKFV